MNDYGYGLWFLVAFNSVLFIVFAASFFHPKTRRDWRVLGGFWLISAGWKALYVAQKKGELATSGAYARIRHPQYLGFILIMVGFLLQWPTLATLAMFPVLLFVYRRLAIREEREVGAEFGDTWERYASVTPRFLPRRHAVASRPGPVNPHGPRKRAVQDQNPTRGEG